MKKVLSFALAVLMGMTMFAQNYHFYSEDFSNGMPDEWKSNRYIESIDDEDEDGIPDTTYAPCWESFSDEELGWNLVFTTIRGGELSTAPYVLTIDDTMGYIYFKMITVSSVREAVTSCNIYLLRDGQILGRLDSVAVDVNESEFLYDLAQYNIGLEATPHSYQFIIQMIGSNIAPNGTDYAALSLDEFELGSRQLSITFHYDDEGVTGSKEPMTIFANKYFEVPDGEGFEREGYSLVGWYTRDDDGEYYVMVGDMVATTDNMRFFARWGKEHTVTFDANGGLGQQTVPVVVADTVVEGYQSYYWKWPGIFYMPECTMTREGYYFIGWNSAADGSGDAYDPGDMLGTWGDTIFYAQWSTTAPEPPAGISDVDIAGVSIYPNPVWNYVQVSGITAQRIDVMDLAGRTLNTVAYANRIDLSGLNKGVYMLRIATAEGIIMQKIVKR